MADNLIAGVFSEELFLQDEFLANSKKGYLGVSVVTSQMNLHYLRGKGVLVTDN